MTSGRRSLTPTLSLAPSLGERLRRRGRIARRALIAGYTVVEVMMAMAVLSIGATGVIAMQKTALLGNLRARNLATASAIASAWVERLRIDGVRWTIDGAGVNTIAATTYLSIVQNDFPQVTAPEGVWFTPAANPPDPALAGVQPTKDVRGMDTAVPTEQGFCTNIRLTQVLPNMIRAEVRVFWLRNQGGGSEQTGTLAGQPLCPVNNQAFLNNDLTTAQAQERYHFVYLSSTILRNDD